MPYANRSVVVTRSTPGDLVALTTAAEDAIGKTLAARGWSCRSVSPDSAGTATIRYSRIGERDRDFDHSTAKQWTDIQRRLASALDRLGWSHSITVAPIAPKPSPVAKVEPIAVESGYWRCSCCGVDNRDYEPRCMACFHPREDETTLDTGSELEQLLAAVETAQRNLRNFLARR